MVRLAAQMHLPDLLAAEPRSAPELARTVSALPQPLHRFLRGLAALGVFEELDDGRFTLTDVGRHFLDKPGSLRSSAIALPQEGGEAFREIRHAVETGRTGYEKAFGLSRWEHLSSLPDAAADFQRFMTATSERIVPGLLREFDFSGLQVVADVGGGHGGLLAGVLAAHPGLQGILFDLPAGLAGAEDHLRRKGVAERCTLVAGDFFDGVPDGADAYLLKFVLHDWQDEECSRILDRCRAATSMDAQLLIVERLLPDRATPADLSTVMADIQMLVVIGGRERTRAEFESLLDGAGFRLDRAADLNGELHLLVARPV
jgi:orsellinic acid C2-O-methyltransferase